MIENYSVGFSSSLSRMRSKENIKKSIDQLNESQLNSIEFGLTNCMLGVNLKQNRRFVLPYPSDNQLTYIKSIFKKDIHTSIHGPYIISATSGDEKKLKFSKANLTKCLKIGDQLAATHVTFHAGSFSTRIDDYIKNVKHVIDSWEKDRKEKGYKTELAPEVAGKVNGFADIFTLTRIAEEIGCLITWDISHDFARGGFLFKEEDILKRLNVLDELELSKERRLPIHLSGMIAGRKGEKHHTLLGKGDGVPWKFIISVLKEQNFIHKVNIICESKIPKGSKLKGNSITDAKKILEFTISDKLKKTPKLRKNRLDYFFSGGKND